MRIFTIILLFILGIAALGGGWVLISDPTGESLGIPMALLKGTAFKDYLIPGVILFVFNGLLSLFALALGLKKIKKVSNIFDCSRVYTFWLADCGVDDKYEFLCTLPSYSTIYDELYFYWNGRKL